MADVQLLAPGVEPAPLDYVIPGAQEILIKALHAAFDGTGAGGSFVPCVQLVAPSGVLAATCPLGSTVVAGASADVTWFPRGGAVAAGTSGAGLQFDTDNEGGWLDITTNNTDASGLGLHVVDTSGGGQKFESGAGGTSIVAGSGGLGTNSSGGTTIQDNSAGGVFVNEVGSGAIANQQDGAGGITDTDNGNGGLLYTTTGSGNAVLSNTGGTGLVQLKNDSGAAAPGIINLYAPGTTTFGMQLIPCPGDAAQIGYVPNGGNPNPGDVTLIGANIEMFAYTTEPTSTMISSQIGGKLYFYDPTGTGTAGNLHLKVIFDNGTKVTLATA